MIDIALDMYVTGEINDCFLGNILQGRELNESNDYMKFVVNLLPLYFTQKEWRSLCLKEKKLRTVVSVAAEATAILFVDNAWEYIREFGKLPEIQRKRKIRELQKHGKITKKKYSTGVGKLAKKNRGWN